MERIWGIVQLAIGIPFLVLSLIRFGEFARLSTTGLPLAIAASLMWALGVSGSGYLCLCGWRRLRHAS